LRHLRSDLVSPKSAEIGRFLEFPVGSSAHQKRDDFPPPRFSRNGCNWSVGPIKTGITNMPSKFIRTPAPEKSRPELLAEVAGLPRSAFIPTAHAAAYLGSSPGVMLNWRSQRRGPRYHGKNDFVRYRISDLDMWMSTRANEIRGDESSTVGAEPSSCRRVSS
jgi:hypothetical protein